MELNRNSGFISSSSSIWFVSYVFIICCVLSVCLSYDKDGITIRNTQVNSHLFSDITHLFTTL
nr:MAG TPA: hypothetical protein [Caudoviricetes sp.]